VTPDPSPPAPSAPDADLHAANMARLRRTLLGYTVLKIGVLSLVAVLLWRFFGQG
jgi:hypothetical protein